VTQENWAS